MSTFASFSAYVKRRWSFEIVAWKDDGEKVISSKWATWTNYNGYEVKISSSHTQQQDDHAERSGGMLQTFGTNLRAIFNLPDAL